MNTELRKFIEEHIDKIDRCEFDIIYDLLADEITCDHNSQYELISNFTVTMQQIGIEPANYMQYIPVYYLYNQGCINYDIPAHIDNINHNAFMHSDLVTLKIPSKVRVIGVRACYECENLHDVIIEDGCMIIGDEAFMNCENLEHIYIPESVTILHDDIFVNCPNLVIHCKEGSEADRYATEYDIPTTYH